MKKALSIVILLLTFIVIYFLQLNFFSWFTIAKIKPNMFVILVLFIGLFAGRRMGTIFGIIFGLIIDLIGSSLFGASSIAYGILGFMRRLFRKKFFKR